MVLLWTWRLNMQTELEPQLPNLLLELSIPDPARDLAPFPYDPLSLFLGETLDTLLAPVLAGSPVPQQGSSGRSYLVYTLVIPANYGIVVSLRQLGEVGVFNDAGYLRVQAPIALESFVREHLGGLLAAGPHIGYSGDSRLFDAWLKLETGMHWTFAVPLLGQLEVRVG
jgi:hypothetical protein